MTFNLGMFIWPNVHVIYYYFFFFFLNFFSISSSHLVVINFISSQFSYVYFVRFFLQSIPQWQPIFEGWDFIWWCLNVLRFDARTSYLGWLIFSTFGLIFFQMTAIAGDLRFWNQLFSSVNGRDENILEIFIRRLMTSVVNLVIRLWSNKLRQLVIGSIVFEVQSQLLNGC